MDRARLVGEILGSDSNQNVAYWHKCEVEERPLLRRLWGLSGHQSAMPNDAIYEYTP
jgi:hypothetical protein